MDIATIWAWITSHLPEIIAIGWALEKFLELVATLTPWKWDDNLGVILGKLLLVISGRKPA